MSNEIKWSKIPKHSRSKRTGNFQSNTIFGAIIYENSSTCRAEQQRASDGDHQFPMLVNRWTHCLHLAPTLKLQCNIMPRSATMQTMKTAPDTREYENETLNNSHATELQNRIVCYYFAFRVRWKQSQIEFRIGSSNQPSCRAQCTRIRGSCKRWPSPRWAEIHPE